MDFTPLFKVDAVWKRRWLPTRESITPGYDGGQREFLLQFTLQYDTHDFWNTASCLQNVCLKKGVEKVDVMEYLNIRKAAPVISSHNAEN